MGKKRILVGSPVHQKPQILKEFLKSLTELKQESIKIDYIFIDDNDLEESSKLLNNFKNSHNSVTIFKGKKQDEYIRDDETHHWSENLIWKVADFKNKIIKEATKLDYDYLFLVDSDIIMYPNTMEHLVSTGKDIICEIFWSIWNPGEPELPNVWVFDEYNMFFLERGELERGKFLAKEEEDLRHKNFLQQLRKPGIYEIGGLGACTLVSRNALLAGVNFNLIKNVSFWGEDRHFCIRACALGLSLFVDTHYPAYHIYRESDLVGVEEFKRKAFQGI